MPLTQTGIVRMEARKEGKKHQAHKEAVKYYSDLSFYDMEEEVNYYLSEESEIYDKFNFNKINPDELYKIYDNLGNAYDLIDQLRLRNHMGE